MKISSNENEFQLGEIVRLNGNLLFSPYAGIDQDEHIPSGHSLG